MLKGENLKFDDLTDEQIESLRGARGLKGDRGIKGDPGEMDMEIVQELRIEMECLNKSVKEFVVTSTSKSNKNLEKKLNSESFKVKIADDIADLIYEKIRVKLISDVLKIKTKKSKRNTESDSSIFNMLDNFINEK